MHRLRNNAGQEARHGHSRRASMTRPPAPAAMPGPGKAKVTHGDRRGRARHMQTIAYSHQMQYATVINLSRNLGLAQSAVGGGVHLRQAEHLVHVPVSVVVSEDG